MARNSKEKSNIKTKIIIFLIISCILCSTLFFSTKLETWLNNLIYPEISADVSSCELKVHFIDVGQGDSILIELPDDKIMLVDAGPGSSEDKLLIYLNSFFQTKNDLQIDYFMVTHQDEDHIGGADVVFQNFEVLNFYRPPVYTADELIDLGFDADTCSTKCFTDMITLMYAENCMWFAHTIEVDNLFNLDQNCNYTIDLLSPIDEEYSDPNNYSPIMIITYQGRKIMLTGDAEEKVEKQVLDKYSASELKCDILKLGHHGSSTSSCQDFISAVNPTYAVISVGQDNKYNHPTDEVLARINSFVGSHNVYRTDTQGNIIFGIDKDSLSNEKGEIKIATNKGTIIKVEIKWWVVVVTIEGLVFIIIFIPKNKKTLKKLKKIKKS